MASKLVHLETLILQKFRRKYNSSDFYIPMVHDTLIFLKINEKKNWRVFASFCLALIHSALARNGLVMVSVSYAGKNAYSAGKTSGVLRGGSSGANRCYVLAHCGGGELRSEAKLGK